MAKTILDYGDYEGALPDGWKVLEVPPGKVLVDRAELSEAVKQLEDARAVINQTARVFGIVNRIDPNLFSTGTVNWGSLVLKLQRSAEAKDMGPEFAKLNALVQQYSTKHNIKIV